MKKFVFVLLCTILAFSMSGCNLVPSVELTEDEQNVISEYAAGLLLKYDKNYGGALASLEEEDDSGVGIVQNEEAKIPTALEELVEEDEAVDATQPEFSEDIAASDNSSVDGGIEYSNLSVADAIGLDGFDIIYKSYEAHKIYPEEESENLVFSMQAQNGMELLVVNFGITNESEARKTCDVLNTNTSFRLVINESERVNANKTILLNDLGSYSDEIDGYGMADAVLVFELAEGTSNNISSLDLVVKKGDESTVHRLK